MDADIIPVASTLARRGWLPGIDGGPDDDPAGMVLHANGRLATVADLHLSAHNEIVRRGWSYEFIRDNKTYIWMWGYEEGYVCIDGITTLSLLQCLINACEAVEKETTDGR